MVSRISGNNINSIYRNLSDSHLKVLSTVANSHWNIKHPNLDVEYLLDERNVNQLEANISKRKGIGNVNLIHSLKKQLDQISADESNFQVIQRDLLCELLKVPNKTHPHVFTYGNEPMIIKLVNEKKQFEHKPLEFHEIAKRLNLTRTEHLGNLSGNRSYYLLGELVELESALIKYVTNYLFQKNFHFITVPDLLPRHVIENCGMNTKGDRTQVYSLDPNMHGSDLCLSGTSEMALAGYFAGKVVDIKNLPIKLAAISRCYRAEISSTAEERGIYRVHEFTKVEMFIVSHPENSNEELEYIRQFQEDYFEQLGLHFKVLDMPPHELGAPAYRKYDIEAWLPGRLIYGELSSCSNCTDYQSRRLSIKFQIGSEEGFCHTLNGTACAVPRLLIALIENGQNKNGTVTIPDVLQRYMDNKKIVGKQKRIPSLKLIKYK